MKRRRAFLLAMSLAGVVLNVQKGRAMCPGPLTFDQHFAGSSTVFIGRATAQEVVDAPSEPGGRVTETTFVVEELWKGKEANTLRIRTCGWTVAAEIMTCSDAIRLIIGIRYVVFASGNPLETSDCGPTAPIERSSEVLEWLSGKPHKKSAG